jgi:flagellin
MALVIATNIGSLNAQKSLSKAITELEISQQRLSSGKRINSAKDDAAGLAIAIKMHKNNESFSQGKKNAGDAISLLNTQEAGMKEITEMLLRMRVIATQASNGIFSSTDLNSLNVEFAALIEETNRQANSITFNDIAILNVVGSLGIQVGSGSVDSLDRIFIFTRDVTSATLGVDSLSVLTSTDALASIAAIDLAIGTLNDNTANIGASNNVLEKAIIADEAQSNSLLIAIGRITDADMAEEAAQLAKNGVLEQVGIAMLAQANQTAALALQLIKS